VKRLLLIALILVVLVAVILLCILGKPVSFTEPETVNGKILKEEPHPKLADASTASTLSSPELPLLPQVTMTAVEYKIDPFALNREREDPPFEFRGGAGTGRVIDRQGNVLLESSEDIGIFGASVSPDKKKVLVDAANSSGGNSLVLEPEADRKTKLPSRPPGANMFSFSWQWIGPNLLFGVSGVEKIFHEGPHENCGNDDNVAQTKFYTFDLLTEQLSEVVMPSAVTQPVVNAMDVTSDGHIHLRHEEPHEGAEQDLGWFKIDAATRNP